MCGIASSVTHPARFTAPIAATATTPFVAPASAQARMIRARIASPGPVLRRRVQLSNVARSVADSAIATACGLAIATSHPIAAARLTKGPYGKGVRKFLNQTTRPCSTHHDESGFPELIRLTAPEIEKTMSRTLKNEN